MASLLEKIRKCEAALASEVEQRSENDDAQSHSSPQMLDLVKPTMDALSTEIPVPRLSEGIAGHCSSLLELCGPEDTVLLRVITQFLADMSLNDENGAMLLRFGIPSFYLLVLQEWSTLPLDTLRAVFDLLSTISSSNAQTRQTLRPCIPYILAAVEHHLYEMDILHGGMVTLSMLTTMSDENCSLIVQCGGLQTLLSAFYHAHRMEDTVQKVRQKKSFPSSSVLLARAQDRRLKEQTDLSLDVQRWCRDVLLKVCRTRTKAVQDALKKADFGVYGRCIPLDELKWSLIFEQRG